MGKMKVVDNPFKQKGLGVKVYSSKRKISAAVKENEEQEQTTCNCSLCRIGRRISREVRGQFSRYGKV
jgi:hypothetical protein